MLHAWLMWFTTDSLREGTPTTFDMFWFLGPTLLTQTRTQTPAMCATRTTSTACMTCTATEHCQYYLITVHLRNLEAQDGISYYYYTVQLWAIGMDYSRKG